MGKTPTLRIVGLVLLIIGLIVPILIDEYETANRLDISRDVGSLPWVIMAVVGAGLLIYSMIGRKS